LEAGPEAVVEAPEGEQTEGQVETPPAEGEPEEKKSDAAKRREREKAYRARLQSDREAAEARAEQADARRKAVVEAGKKEAAPRENDFPDPIEFAAAKAIWGAEQRYREREADGAGEAVQAAKREVQEIDARERAVIEQSWTAQLADAKARYADFDAVALSDEVPVTPAMGDLIKTSDVGADVAYHLGQNRGLAAQIAKMNPLEAARAIGRIEASLQMPKARTETNAPQPITPVRGGASASLNADKMSMEEYMAARKSGKIR
jgi:hypothetical protein